MSKGTVYLSGTYKCYTAQQQVVSQLNDSKYETKRLRGTVDNSSFITGRCSPSCYGTNDFGTSCRNAESVSMLYLSAESLIVLFTLEAACEVQPVDIVIVTYSNELTESKNLQHFCAVSENRSISDSEECFVSSSCSKVTKKLLLPKNTEKCVCKQHCDETKLPKSKWSSHIFPICLTKMRFKAFFADVDSIPTAVRKVHFPSLLSKDTNVCVAGTCAVLRRALQIAASEFKEPRAKDLLGFREGCLQACSEVSCWTKFCEVEMPLALSQVYNDIGETPNCFHTSKCSLSTGFKGAVKRSAKKCELPADTQCLVVPDKVDTITFPTTLLRFNNHLARPPILHNALKVKQQIIQKTVRNKTEREALLCKKLNELPELDHEYAEGLHLTLADIILFVCIDLIRHRQHLTVFEKQVPLVKNWHALMQSKIFITRCLPLLHLTKLSVSTISCNENDVFIPNVLEESLYKSDPDRPKLHHTGSLTLQGDIDRLLSIFDENNIFPNYHKIQDLNAIELNWMNLPSAIHPLKGELPPKRLLKKCQQLENMLYAVKEISKLGDRIVDFCSGGGHVGILLAYHLPHCIVTLVENKASSLDRAKVRVNELGLKNVEFYQCNLDYFCGPFDVGVCLHACGTATDLVLGKCLEQKASFVCSPCCYGSIQPNHSVLYPRCSLYRQLLPKVTDYLVLGHAADQTHAPELPITQQGERCMRLVDFDRLRHAEETGYQVKLFQMHPQSCSPKNHILVGQLLKT